MKLKSNFSVQVAKNLFRNIHNVYSLPKIFAIQSYKLVFPCQSPKKSFRNFRFDKRERFSKSLVKIGVKSFSKLHLNRESSQIFKICAQTTRKLNISHSYLWHSTTFSKYY